jgi:AraC-like DNA-binding protein
VYSQQNDLALKAQELVYSNPDETIKIAEHILKSSQQNQEKALANILVSKSYLVKGEYNKAIIYAFDDLNQFENIDSKTRAENYIIKSTLLRKLYLDKQALEYLNQAINLTSKLPNNIQDSLQNHIALERINMLLDRRNTNDAVVAIQVIEKQFQDFFMHNSDEKKALYLAKARAFNDRIEYDSAYVYIEKTRSLIDSSHVNNLYEKAVIYKELGHVYLQKKELKKSEEALFIALRFAEILDNSNLLMHINRDLAINYLASNQKSQHKVYNDEFLVLNNQVESIEQESVNTLYNILSNQQEDLINDEKQNYNNSLYIIKACALLILVIGVFLILKTEGRKKRLREIINYLEVSRNSYIKTKPIKKTSTKRIVIPEETEQNLLLKLKRFEKSQKYLSKDISLAVLSGQFDTNTKYLSEIINRHYNDNFNTFINKLRINYIIDKLKHDSNYMNYKISFLASESGFSSHSSFATVFKTIIGMSPVTFIDLLKSDRVELEKLNEKE